jgi:hypothetical protein
MTLESAKRNPDLAELARPAAKTLIVADVGGPHSKPPPTPRELSSPRALTEYVPLFKHLGETTVLGNVSNSQPAQNGLFGLRTLTVIYDTIAMVKQNHGVEPSRKSVSRMKI